MRDLSNDWPDLQPSSERVALEQHLDFCRLAAIARLEDLNEEQSARRAVSGSDLTVAGVIKHLAWAEDRWFTGKLLGEDLPEPWRSAPLDSEPDWPFFSAEHDTVRDTVELYAEACARSRSAAQSYSDLSETAHEVSFDLVPVTLRWLYVHMIQETAWHLGHLDLLRSALGVPSGPE